MDDSRNRGHGVIGSAVPMHKTTVNLPDDVREMLERSAASVGQSPSQFIREAILLRCVVAGGEVTDEIRRIVAELRKS
jgi:predicted transcriptional regulator